MISALSFDTNQEISGCWRWRPACVCDVLWLKVMTDKRRTQSHQNGAASLWHEPTRSIAVEPTKSE
jgi:hypothetical protein